MKWAPFAVGVTIFFLAPMVLSKMPGLAGTQMPGLEGLFSTDTGINRVNPGLSAQSAATTTPDAVIGPAAAPDIAMMQVWVVAAVLILGVIGLALKSGLLFAGRKIDPNLPDPWARIEAQRLRRR